MGGWGAQAAAAHGPGAADSGDWGGGGAGGDGKGEGGGGGGGGGMDVGGGSPGDGGAIGDGVGDAGVVGGSDVGAVVVEVVAVDTGVGSVTSAAVRAVVVSMGCGSCPTVVGSRVQAEHRLWQGVAPSGKEEEELLSDAGSPEAAGQRRKARSLHCESGHVPSGGQGGVGGGVDVGGEGEEAGVGVGGVVGGGASGAVGVEVGDGAGDGVGDGVGNEAGGAVGAWVGDGVGDEAGDAVGDGVGDLVGDWVGDEVGGCTDALAASHGLHVHLQALVLGAPTPLPLDMAHLSQVLQSLRARLAHLHLPDTSQALHAHPPVLRKDLVGRWPSSSVASESQESSVPLPLP